MDREPVVGCVVSIKYDGINDDWINYWINGENGRQTHTVVFRL